MSEMRLVNGVPYRIGRLLGRGKGGYSYLACREGGDTPVVLKQIHHEPCEYYTFGNKIEAERNDYTRLTDAGIRIPTLIDIDPVTERLVKTYIDGPTVAALAEANALPAACLDEVRQMAALAKAKGLNIDYYPTNFIYADGLLWYIDYECNPYDDRWSFETWGKQYWGSDPTDRK